jgi:hypothetical protein
MNPKQPEHLEIALNPKLTNAEKLGALLPEPSDIDPKQKIQALEDLINRVKEYAKALTEDPHSPEEAERGQHESSAVNFKTPRLPIAETELGQLELEFFIYTPVESHYQPSINARWFIRDEPEGLNILQEYVAAKPLQAEKLPRLDLIEQSFEAYQEAWEQSQTD